MYLYNRIYILFKNISISSLSFFKNITMFSDAMIYKIRVCRFLHPSKKCLNSSNAEILDCEILNIAVNYIIVKEFNEYFTYKFRTNV